jgi:regulator of replication initiation timing
MDMYELFELAEMLDDDINSMQTQLSDLKAYREHIQKGIESAIASMESNTGE